MGMIVIVLTVYPALALLAGVLGYLFFKNVLIAPVVVFISFLLLQVFAYNSSFFIWVCAYTVVALGTSFLAKGIHSLLGSRPSS
ncbi:DUF2651 family protein [Thalassobacillus hwangdonensis]|uniref:DUF2651 family protein n=1 Tax=Thalassobacillus hwangdonensis TaxID=546108 RepID=A0ABW3L0T8_9BACI